MPKQLTEKRVLKALGVPDFRHIGKDQVMKLASIYDKMDPEVAKKVIEQIPEFTKIIREGLVEYKDVIDKMIDSSNDNARSFYNNCQMVLNSLQNELDKGDLSQENKADIFDRMNNILRTEAEFKKQHDEFLSKQVDTVSRTLLGLATIILTVYAAKSNVDLSSIGDGIKNRLSS